MNNYLTKSEIVYKGLEEMIAHGELGPGHKVSATEVAQKFHVSRTPVNEAVKRLSDRGLVKILPNVGFEVTVLEWSEIEDSMRLKMVLEKTVITWIRDKHMRVDTEPVKKLANRLIETITQKDFVGYTKLIREFHLKYIALANSKPLLNNYTFAWDYRGLEEPRFQELASSLLDLTMDHVKVLQCIDKKDFNKALEISDEHEKKWIAVYKDYLADSGLIDLEQENN